jgi:hypothetical protein
MDLKAKLQEARDLISDESRWTQGTNAVDARGIAVHPGHPDACKWCARGALLKVFGIGDLISEAPQEERAAYYAVRDTLDACASAQDSTKAMVGINDELGHAATLKMFDCGIAKHS